MSQHIPNYKLAVPQVPNQLRRDALLGSLGLAHQSHAITWIVGLPGAGKTSLVARWVQESQTPCVWYRLDETDADVAAFFNALSHVAPASASLPNWSPENQADLGDFSRRFFGELARQPLTIVLDDCHRVPDDSAIIAMLGFAREVCGEHLRWIVSSRRAAPHTLARGQMGGWLQVIDNLRLSNGEATALSQGIRGRDLLPQEALSLQTADGWLAHVLALARSPTSAADFTPGSATHVGDFLAAELLASLPLAHRPALRHLAELPEIPQLTPHPVLLPGEVVRLLASLSQQRYFVDSTARNHWRLHDLLRDALRAHNQTEETLQNLQQVRRNLATWVETAMPEAAMQLCVVARDVEGALALLRTHGNAWLAKGLHRSVYDWVRALPEPASAPHQLERALWQAQALLPLEPEHARPLFANVRRAAVVASDATAAYTAWCGEVASYVVQWGAVQGLAQLVNDLEALIQQLGPPLGELAFRVSADALTALMYGGADDPRIGHYAQATALAVAHAPDAGARTTAAAQLLIYKLWWQGDFPGGRALYDAFDAEVSEGEHLAALPRLMWWSCASIIDWQCGNPQDCYDKVERGLALARTSGVHVRDFFLLTQGIFCALSQENWPRAEQYLEQLARTERTHKRLDAMVFHFFQSWYYLCRGNPANALAHAQTAWPMAEAMGSMFHKVIVLSALAPARLHNGDVAGAQAAYHQQLALAKAARNPTFSFIAFCAGSEIALVQKDEEALAKQVERMLTVKRLGGFHSGCGWRTPHMRQVLAFALRKGIAPDVARQWIREKAITPPVGADRAWWPMPVRIEALTGLTVRLDAGSASDTAASTKPAAKLRMFLAILAARPEGATQTDLIDWLWPDTDGDKAAASLKAAVHRMRQWLGAQALRVTDSVVSLNPDVVACDLWEHLAPMEPVDASQILAGFDAPPIAQVRLRWANGVAHAGK